MPVIVESEELEAPRPRHGPEVVLNAIEQAIATTQADLDALERTREIFARQSHDRASVAGPS